MVLIRTLEAITVTVGEVNVPPVLAVIGDQSVDELTELAFTATATDVDDPVQSLVFSLAGEPVGASITAGGDFGGHLLRRRVRHLYV